MPEGLVPSRYSESELARDLEELGVSALTRKVRLYSPSGVLVSGHDTITETVAAGHAADQAIEDYNASLIVTYNDSLSWQIEVLAAVPNGTVFCMSEDGTIRRYYLSTTPLDGYSGYTRINTAGAVTLADYAALIAAAIASSFYYFEAGVSLDGNVITCVDDVEQIGGAFWSGDANVIEVTQVGGTERTHSGVWDARLLQNVPYEAFVVVASPGTYSETLDMPPNSSLIGIGRVVLDGALSLGDNAISKGVLCTGSVSGSGTYEPVWGAADGLRSLTVQDASGEAVLSHVEGHLTGRSSTPLAGGPVSMSEDRSSADRVLPGPYITDVRGLLCCIVDDINSTWDVAMSSLGGLTPREYAKAHNVPFSYPILPDWIGGPNMLSTADIQDSLAAVGGELMWHDHQGDEHGDQVARLFAAVEAIEEIGYPVRAGAHTADYSPWNASDQMRALCRMLMSSFRVSGTSGFTTFPAPRYGGYADKITAQADSTGAVHNIRRRIEMLAASEGLVWCTYTHGITDGTTPSDDGWTVAQFKAFVDAAEAAQLAGAIAIVPFWQLAATQQHVFAPNYILNPGFEYKDDEGGDDGFTFAALGNSDSYRPISTWPQSATGTAYELTTSDKHTGSMCCQLTRTVNGCRLQYHYIPVLHPGRQLRLRFWHKTASGSNDASVIIAINNSWGDARTYTIPVATSWTLHHINLLLPSGCTSIHVGFQPGTNTVWRIDDLYLGH